MLHARAEWSKLLDQRREREIEEHHAIFRVVHDVDELVVEEPRVDGMDDRSAPRHGIVKLEVAIAIPGERGYPVFRFDTQSGERACQAPCTQVRVAIGIAMNRPFEGSRYDFAVAMAAIRVTNQ